MAERETRASSQQTADDMKVAKGWRKGWVYLGQDIGVPRWIVWGALLSMGLDLLVETEKVLAGTSWLNRAWAWLRACP